MGNCCKKSQPAEVKLTPLAERPKDATPKMVSPPKAEPAPKTSNKEKEDAKKALDAEKKKLEGDIKSLEGQIQEKKDAGYTRVSSSDIQKKDVDSDAPESDKSSSSSEPSVAA
eukprot:Blabericola_migrator_1__12670@NODE_80_length_15038_cov_227_068532_g72_i0_p18_GENE_NODE_80_length_15038_cov_227_068532_g72_i0NODE_80_length_15038_cov_227_068532_g72_i0_p18_ORF_typecomplete_len113_score29_80Prefoldin_2/PF01920_20/0_011SidC_N/PF18219_1/0_13DUF5320/PF17253_2/0_16_NODE_80_length_15038_cov_227_068532_g72_i01377014108